MHMWVLSGLGFSLHTSFTDSAVSNVLLALACVVVSNTLQYYLPQRERYWHLFVLSLVLSGAWLLAIKNLLPLALQDTDGYYAFLSHSWYVRFGVGFLIIGSMAMISMLWYTFEEQRASARRKADAEKLTREAELYKLRQQLQPHFLFNSLNSINALIGLRPEEARRMVQQLSEFLRGTLKREEHQWIDLREELQHLQLYLDIEKVRFGNRLSTTFDIEEASLGLKIPAMLLQPVVENAIKFGLYDTVGETNISIATAFHDGMLELTVQNPFDPETSQPRQGTGFGLNSIQRRLYLLFSRQDLLQVQANGNIFTTTVKIPQ
ncbi:MAG: histidine kinase [Bacteroidetes bacterium]|nr:histidine kinase [Bacteroidota bacterium]